MLCGCAKWLYARVMSSLRLVRNRQIQVQQGYRLLVLFHRRHPASRNRTNARDMAQSEQYTKAQQILSQAEKKKAGASGGGWLGNLGLANPESKLEEAAELFAQAGNAFKAGKHHSEAAEAYIKEAKCYEKCKSLENDAANAYWNAAKSFKSGSNISSESAS